MICHLKIQENLDLQFNKILSIINLSMTIQKQYTKNLLK